MSSTPSSGESREEWLRTTLSILSRSVTARGFRLNARQHQFTRDVNGIRCALRLSVNHKPDALEIDVHLGMRHEDVENLIPRVLPGWYKPKATVLTYTCGIELGNLECGRFKVWRVASDNDAVETGCGIVSSLERAGYAFCDMCADKRRLLGFLTSTDPLASIVTQADLRAKTVVAIAYLLGDRAEYLRFVAQMRIMLEERDPKAVTGFDEFVESLRM